jgi:hypothetical protein
MNTKIHTFEITVSVQAPGAEAPILVPHPGGYAWDMQSATKYVVDQTISLPAGTKLTIGVELFELPEIAITTRCERAAAKAAHGGANLRLVAMALHLDESTITWSDQHKVVTALSVLTAAQASGKTEDAILAAFAING